MTTLGDLRQIAISFRNRTEDIFSWPIKNSGPKNHLPQGQLKAKESDLTARMWSSDKVSTSLWMRDDVETAQDADVPGRASRGKRLLRKNI